MAIGSANIAWDHSLAQGISNTASANSFAQGLNSRASSNSFAQGKNNLARNYSFAQGYSSEATANSFAQGDTTRASSYSFAQGRQITAKNTAAVFGQFNLRGDGHTGTGNSAAFAIGDGVASNARHDLMLVTKDGEITMYSSTADTVGTGIMSSIRAISAAATGGGGVDSATVSAIASSYAESAVSSKLDESATADFYSTSNPSSFVDSAYVDSAVSGKQDALTFDYDADSAISSINGSALAGGGVTGDYLTAVIGSDRARLATGFQNNNNNRPLLFISAERDAERSTWPRMILTDWNKTTGLNHSGMLLADGFEFYQCPDSAYGQVDPSGIKRARLDPTNLQFLVDTAISSDGHSANYGRSGLWFFPTGGSALSISISSDTSVGPFIQLNDNSGSSGKMMVSSIGYWDNKLDSTAFNSADFYTTANESGFVDSAYVEGQVSGKQDASAMSAYQLTADMSGYYTTANESGYVDSAYVDSAVSGKQDTLTFDYDADSAISAINGSALAEGGDYVENSSLDSASARSATGSVLPTATGISSISGKPLIPTLLAQPTMQYGGQSTFAYMPDTALWTTADEATGVFTPLRYATGACLAMDAGYFKAYYKGNEWFVADNRHGMVRGEVHQSRGLRIVASSTSSASGFELHPSGVVGVSGVKAWALKPEGVSGIGGGGTAWQYGTAEYTQLTSVYDTVSANSASWAASGIQESALGWLEV